MAHSGGLSILLPHHKSGFNVRMVFTFNKSEGYINRLSDLSDTSEDRNFAGFTSV